MRDDSTSQAAGGWMGAALIVMLMATGIAIYFVAAARHEAHVQKRVAEANLQQALAHAEAASAAAARSQQLADERVRLAHAGQESGDAVRAEVEAVMQASEEAWNRGDVESFVGHYWKSDEVTFSGGGKTTRGWEATAQRYRERYPTREKMGRLSFDHLEITSLGDEAALVLGEWKLESGSEQESGNFSLVFRKIDGQWVIVHDHTSRAEK